MPVEHKKSDVITNLERNGFQPGLVGMRMQYIVFNHKQTPAGDATSTVELAKLPPGKVTLVGSASHVGHTDINNDVDVGHRAYTKPDGSIEAEDVDDLNDAEATANAGSFTLGKAVGQWQFKTYESKDGVTIFLTKNTGALPNNAEINGVIAYIQHG